MNTRLPFLLVLILAFGISCNKLPEKPNIIYILADDLGYGDLSCYGQELFATPNLDRLAENGMRFTQHYSGSTVCAPSRSSLMTGLHTGHTFIRGNKPWKPEGQWPIPDSVLTIAEVLKEAGYVTGAFGKWGLGFVDTEGGPTHQGFDVFFGYNCQRIAHNYYPFWLWDNETKIKLVGNVDTLEKQYAPEMIHDQALHFIRANHDKPFFMFYPNVIPHAELKVPNPYFDKYRGKYLPEKNYRGTDSGPHYKVGGYGSQPESHAAFVGMVDYMDTQVGEVLDLLDELALSDKTIVFFSSDNGPHAEGGADPNYFNSNGPFKGIKRDLYEGGIRVPFMVSWPGMIEPGSISEHISAFWDMFPTFADLAGVNETDGLDGISMVNELTGKKQANHEFLYWEFHERQGRVAVRMGQWKGVKYQLNTHPERALELYDLNEDPGEENNLADDHPDIVKLMLDIIAQEHTDSPDFKLKGLDSQ